MITVAPMAVFIISRRIPAAIACISLKVFVAEGCNDDQGPVRKGASAPHGPPTE